MRKLKEKSYFTLKVERTNSFWLSLFWGERAGTLWVSGASNLTFSSVGPFEYLSCIPLKSKALPPSRQAGDVGVLLVSHGRDPGDHRIICAKQPSSSAWRWISTPCLVFWSSWNTSGYSTLCSCEREASSRLFCPFLLCFCVVQNEVTGWGQFLSFPHGMSFALSLLWFRPGVSHPLPSRKLHVLGGD